jgi:predicted HD phosphohydrolase
MLAAVRYLLGLERKVYPTDVGEVARARALDVLERHALQAHWYAPAVGCTDGELADALRLLGDSGHLITDRHGALVGRFATCRPTHEECAAMRRASFRVVRLMASDASVPALTRRWLHLRCSLRTA